MLDASRLKANQGKLIAGGAGGSHVRCSKQALPTYNELVKLANAGNYWAGLVVRGIKGLTSGRLHMDNVYVQQDKNITYGRGVFYLVLPGVKATLESCDYGGYLVQSLSADLNYLQKQEEKRKPGLWRITKDKDPSVGFLPEGDVLKKPFRPVVISDRTTEDPKDIAIAARDDLTGLDKTIKRMVDSTGFDLHHTPGDKGIVGLKPAHKALATNKDQAITESATLLANTMYRARNIDGVLWFSDWGGSAVLTRALEILEVQKPTFKNHAIYLNRPTSNSSKALKIAEKLELGLGGKGGKSVGYQPKEIIGNHLRADLSASGLAKTGVFALSAAGAALGFAGAAPTAAGAVGVAGGMYFVTTAIKAGAKKLSGKKY